MSVCKPESWPAVPRPGSTTANPQMLFEFERNSATGGDARDAEQNGPWPSEKKSLPCSPTLHPSEESWPRSLSEVALPPSASK